MNQECSFKLDIDVFNVIFKDGGLQNIRIKNIAFSLPSVNGPYTSTNIKVSYDGEEVITSTAVNDAAVHPANSNEKYLPFEYKEIDPNKEWKVQLPTMQTFDYSTISDLVLHIQFDAEKDSSTSTTVSSTNYQQMLMSWKHDFAQDWYKMLGDPPNLGSHAKPTLELAHIPYRMRGNVSTPVSPNGTFYYLTQDGTKDVMVKESNASTILSFDANGELMVNNEKVVDIWLMYDL